MQLGCRVDSSNFPKKTYHFHIMLASSVSDTAWSYSKVAETSSLVSLMQPVIAMI